MKHIKAVLIAAIFAFTAPAFALGLGNDNPGGTGIATASQGQNQGQNQGQAQGQLQGQGQGQGQAQGLVNTNVIGVDVSNRITNDVRNNAAAFSASLSKSNSQSSSSSSATGGNGFSAATGGDSRAISGSGGNTLTVNEAPIPANTSVTYGGEYTVKGVPNVVTGNVYPTAPCMGSSTIGGSGVGFGFGIGTSWKDDECGIRETARSFAGMGMKDDALAILCTSEYAVTAPSCVKPVAAQLPAAEVK